ncbi:MAG: type II toxin-antitoxin system prevent-host-death family antitoxin [Acidobacteriota bacterium]|nr:type II toxin-antitoxin system prevent-host-death family antitoxin [Acidobacteriota bacterium]
MERIGVRELRQNASRYLARVAQGETIQVTDHGRPVALLVPNPSDRWDEMVANGEVERAVDRTPFSDDPPRDFGLRASEELRRSREGER